MSKIGQRIIEGVVKMENSVVLSNWSIDAFECLSSKLLPKLSSELISRVDTFISAYVLFDQIYLSENYVNNKTIEELNSRHPDSIKIICSDDLFHSTDMTKHISIELDLYETAFEELSKENKIWQIQHSPETFIDFCSSQWTDPNISSMLESNFFTKLRMWHWSYTNEMAEKTNSVNMLPLSLNEVGKLALTKEKKTDAILKHYFDYADFHNLKFLRLSELISTPFISEIRSVPPLMAVLLERCKTSEDMVEVLAKMREEYREFRILRHQFTIKIQSTNNVGEQVEVVADWNRAWEAITAGEFKKPNLLKRKVSSTEVASSIVSVEKGAVKTFLSHFIDHYEYKKSYKQFQIFSNLDEHISAFSQKSELLSKKFGVEEIIPLN